MIGYVHVPSKLLFLLILQPVISPHYRPDKHNPFFSDLLRHASKPNRNCFQGFPQTASLRPRPHGPLGPPLHASLQVQPAGLIDTFSRRAEAPAAESHCPGGQVPAVVDSVVSGP